MKKGLLEGNRLGGEGPVRFNATALQSDQDMSDTTHRAKALGAVALAVLVLLCGAFAANSSLHNLIHADADEGGHECAISLFAHGQVHFAGAPPIFTAPVFISLEISLPSPRILILEPRDYLLLPGRAPPTPLS